MFITSSFSKCCDILSAMAVVALRIPVSDSPSQGCIIVTVSSVPVSCSFTETENRLKLPYTDISAKMVDASVFHIRHRFYPALHKRRRSHIAFYTAVLFLLFYCPAKRKAACSPSVTSFSSRFYGKPFLLWCYCFSIYPLIGSAYILSSVTALYRLPSYTSVKPFVAL